MKRTANIIMNKNWLNNQLEKKVILQVERFLLLSVK